MFKFPHLAQSGRLIVRGRETEMVVKNFSVLHFNCLQSYISVHGFRVHSFLAENDKEALFKTANSFCFIHKTFSDAAH